MPDARNLRDRSDACPTGRPRDGHCLSDPDSVDYRSDAWYPDDHRRFRRFADDHCSDDHQRDDHCRDDHHWVGPHGAYPTNPYADDHCSDDHQRDDHYDPHAAYPTNRPACRRRWRDDHQMVDPL